MVKDINYLKNKLKELGLKLIYEEYIYKNSKEKFDVIDLNGFLYYTNLYNIENNKTGLDKYSNKNPYNLYNIKNYIKINNLNCDILENEIKNDFCKNNNISLIRIPYLEFRNNEYKNIIQTIL